VVTEPERGPETGREMDAPGAAHPGPAAVALPVEIREAIIAQARAEDPNESCGLIIGDAPAADGGRALRFEPTRNRAASPYRYEIDPADLLRLTIATDDADEAFWAIVHSHTHTPARPSPTDIGLAFYPDALYMLVTLDPGEADPVTGAAGVRAWRILDGVVHEVAIT
jgi:[CysO sulfur-carrier protein]-S-L-cysteine hydrolase